MLRIFSVYKEDITWNTSGDVVFEVVTGVPVAMKHEAVSSRERRTGVDGSGGTDGAPNFVTASHSRIQRRF